jgi:hypothetical protein
MPSSWTAGPVDGAGPDVSGEDEAAGLPEACRLLEVLGLERTSRRARGPSPQTPSFWRASTRDKLSSVISDIHGVPGPDMLDAIAADEHNPKVLAACAGRRPTTPPDTTPTRG